MLKPLFRFGFVALILVTCFSCGLNQKSKNGPSVNIAITTDPDALNAVTSKTVNGLAINSLLFQKLLEVDFKTLQLTPVLAQSLPTIEYKNDSIILIHYQIRPEAKWDNGSPITADDVIFTLKIAMLPLVDNAAHASYLSFILNIFPDKDDNKKLTFVCSPNLRLEYSTGSEVGILPEYVYDPEQVLRELPFSSVAKNADALKNDPAVIRFAEKFNLITNQPDSINTQGSGGYTFKQWQTGQKVVLQKKDNWWAKKLANTNPYFQNYPEKINWFIIKENAAIISAAKNGQLDAGPIVKSSDYFDLKQDTNFTKTFNCQAVPELSTNVILVNTCNKVLSGVKTRQAMAHLFDVNSYIETIQLSTGKQIIGPLHPSKPEYHQQLKPYEFNIEKAKTLLAEDGWVDSDNDGVLDKFKDGKKLVLELNYKYNTGNEGRKNAGLLFKEWAAQAGVQINVVNEEWLVFIESLMSHSFDLAYFSWNDEYAPTDPSAVYHTTAIANGYNFGCFGFEESDLLIEQIATCSEPEKRKQLWWQLQEILHRDVASIFISTNESRFFISKKFQEYTTGAVNPGFWPGSLK